MKWLDQRTSFSMSCKPYYSWKWAHSK